MRPAGAPTASSASAGFTLLEMLLVLAILGLAAAITLPALRRPPDALRIEGAARTLVSALRFSRAEAIARNEDVVVTMHADRRRLDSSTGPAVDIDREIAVEMVFAASEQRRRAAGAIRFFADGTSSGGDILLALNKRRARITVDWLTGTARMDLAAAGPP